MNKPLWLAIGAALAFLVSDSSGEDINMSGLRKRRSKRLFYMRNDKAVPRAQVEKAKKQAKAGGACLHAVWAYSADEARDLIAQGRAESICRLSGIGKLQAVYDSDKPYMQLSPFSKEMQTRFEYTTFYPYDLNQQFNESVAKAENEAIEKLSNYNVTDMPEDVKTALAYHRKAVYEYLTAKANQVPSPMVTGPSKYNYRKLEKDNQKQDKLSDSLETSREYLRKALNRATKGLMTKTKQASHDQWKQIALVTPKKLFAEKMFESVYNKANPELKKDYDAGVFVRSIKNTGRKLHEQMVNEAIEEGLEIDESVKLDYPEKFGLTVPQKKKRQSQADKLTAYERLIKMQEESEKAAEEMREEAAKRHISEEEKERQRKEAYVAWMQERLSAKKKLIPEQASFTEPSQMTLFGLAMTKEQFRVEQMRKLADQLDGQGKHIIASRARRIAEKYLTEPNSRQEIEISWYDKFTQYDSLYKKLKPKAVYEQIDIFQPSQMTLFGELFKKGDKVKKIHYYYFPPDDKIGTITKVWDTPTGQWGIVFYGKNSTGQRIQNKYPLSVFKKLDEKAKYIPEQTDILQPSQMTLFGAKNKRNALHR